MTPTDVKTTFRQKNPSLCSICEYEFYREELLSGRGRLIAGDLTSELRRQYEESQKYGRIQPLIYPVWVCPRCAFASFSEDFTTPIKKVKQEIKNNSVFRQQVITDLLGSLNFHADRTLQHGVASYILALICYSFFEKQYAPSLKRALCSIRAVWLLEDLMNETESPRFALMRDSFYKKAGYFYRRAVECGTTGDELFENLKSYGPGLDKNFGYEGMLYMSSLLTFKQIKGEPDKAKQIELLGIAKRTVSSLVGSGKASYEKPGVIIDFARDLFKEINKTIKDLEIQLEES